MSATLIDFDAVRGVLIERNAVAADFVDGLPRSIEEYDPHTGRVTQWVSVAEAEDLELLDEAHAESLRAEMAAAKKSKEAA